MITIKKLSECTLEDAVIAWNKGFEGYYFNMTMTVEQFTNRMVLEGLSPSLSIIAYDGERPVGIILNGIRTIDGKKFSWNGGTGVDPEYRGSGVGKQMMDASLEIYENNNVNIASLEAIKENTKAITLYEKKGFEIVDHLAHFQNTELASLKVFEEVETNYHFSKGIPIDVINIPFYTKFVSWQTQWNNARDGEAIIAYSSENNVVGYAIYKRRFNENGELAGITLLQCEVNPEVEEKAQTIKAMLNEVYQPHLENVVRTAANLPQKNEALIEVLKEAGFEVKVEQVYMLKSM